jgi:3-oxoacyl-[acyl-carrier-protein] synthase II
MEPWQRIGTYAAGLALDSAGVKGNAELLARTDMIVAAGGGERDCTVDEAVLAGLLKTDDPDTLLNTRLMSDLRPTLMLAQLSNLLAGNISIVHGVTGSSRTFMGEEQSGVDALRIARARIAAGQSDIALVGGAINGERADLIMLYHFGGSYLEGEHRPVFRRGPQGGMILASLGAFLVLEAREHAAARGATAHAALAAVGAARSTRKPGDVTRSLQGLWGEIEPRLDPHAAAILSGASGAEPATAEERAFLDAHADLPLRTTGDYVGHGVEPQFVMNVALAALAVERGYLFPARFDDRIERPAAGTLRQVVVTSVGHWRGEGLGLVTTAA